MCCAQYFLITIFTLFGSQVTVASFNEDYDISKRHFGSLVRDELLQNNRKQFIDNLEEGKRHIGTLLAKTSQPHGKRNLMDGMIFGDDLRRYLQESQFNKRGDIDFYDDSDDYEKRSYGMDGMVYGEDFRKALQDSSFNNNKRAPYPPMLRGGKHLYGMDGMIFGEDLRRIMQNTREVKRGFNPLIDGMVFGDDLKTRVLNDAYGKRGYNSLMDGMFFGEDLRNNVQDMDYDKRGHGLMDGMVFAEDLRKAIQEANARKEKEKQFQKLKESAKSLSKPNGKRNLQAMAKHGYLMQSNQGKRAGLEALARNGYLNTKCSSTNGASKRSQAILAKNGLIPQKVLNYKRLSFEDDDNQNENTNLAQYRQFLETGKRPFLGHRPNSATTRNIPFLEQTDAEADKRSFMLGEVYNPFENRLQKKYVATLLKEASSPAKINIRNDQKSSDETAADDVTSEEQSKPSASKRSDYNDENNSINDEYTMTVMQNDVSRHMEELGNELSNLYFNNDYDKRYYAVKGGGRILGGRLQEIGKAKQNQSRQRSLF